MWKVRKQNNRTKQQQQHKQSRKERRSNIVDNPNYSKLRRDLGVPDLDDIKASLDKKLERMNARLAKSAHTERLSDRWNRNIENRKKLNPDAAAAAYDDTFRVGGNEAAIAQQRHWYYRELKKVIEASDIILQVLDARDPLGGRCYDIEKDILSMQDSNGNPTKRIILVLNKIDLVPTPVYLSWVRYLRREFPTIAFKSASMKSSSIGQAHTGGLNDAERVLHRSSCIGANALLQLLKNYSRSLNMKKHITVGIIGYPNVGKSSIINSMKRSKAVAVGSTPGLTKSLQEIKLDKLISLIDSPGVMFDSANGKNNDPEELLLRNCLKVEQLEDPISAVYAIVKRCTASTLRKVYDINSFDDADEFISLVAVKRGKLGKGGVPDVESAARTIIKDWNAGIIPYYSSPPIDSLSSSSSSSSSSSIINNDVEFVSAFSKEFDIHRLKSSQIKVEKPEGMGEGGDMEEDDGEIGTKEIIDDDDNNNNDDDDEIDEDNNDGDMDEEGSIQSSSSFVPRPLPDDESDMASESTSSSSSSSSAPTSNYFRTALPASAQRNKTLRTEQKKEKKLKEKEKKKEMDEFDNILGSFSFLKSVGSEGGLQSIPTSSMQSSNHQ